MGSALLYAAIVVMWLSVLLPMWLRRDRQIDEDAFSDHSAAVADEPDADTVVDVPSFADRSEQEDAPAEHAERTSPAEAASLGASGEAAERGEVTDTSDAADIFGADGSPAVPEAVRSPAGRRRARIIARRRRRLLWCILLVLASVVTAAVQVMPWWGVAPSGVLLVSYLAMLRVAVRVDREQQEKAARLRAEQLRRRRAQLEATAQEAEIIEFEARDQAMLFDQHAEGRRAVGD